MSSDPSVPGAPGAQAGQPSEEELRAAYEAELSRITSADMMLQAAVSLLNIGSFRLAPPASTSAQAGGGAGAQAAARDLEQVRDAIDGVKALLEILERRIPSELGPLRNALSQLQMAYAREAQASGGQSAGEPATPAAREPGTEENGDSGQGGEAEPGASEPGQADQRGPGPAESSGRLWVPGR